MNSTETKSWTRINDAGTVCITTMVGGIGTTVTITNAGLVTIPTEHGLITSTGYAVVPAIRYGYEFGWVLTDAATETKVIDWKSVSYCFDVTNDINA